MSTLAPHQFLINLLGPRELSFALGRLVKISQELVCLCATDQQCEWLKRQSCFRSDDLDVIFLSLPKLCQAGRQSRHLKNRVWLLWPFELIWNTEAYFELAENVKEIWALSWGMTYVEQKQWLEAAQNSSLTPQALGVKQGRLDLFLEKKWRHEKREYSKERCCRGVTHQLFYQDEQDLSPWLRWSQRENLTVRQASGNQVHHLLVQKTSRLSSIDPDILAQSAYFTTPNADESADGRYAIGLTDSFKENSLLLRCVRLLALICSRSFRWF